MFNQSPPFDLLLAAPHDTQTLKRLIKIRLKELWLWVESCSGEVYLIWLATGQCYSAGTSVSSTNKTDHHYVAEILLKVMLNTITPTLKTRLTIITFEFFYFIIHYWQQIKNYTIFTRSYIILHTITYWKLRKSNNNRKKNLSKQ